jgi:hypothetical protein
MSTAVNVQVQLWALFLASALFLGRAGWAIYLVFYIVPVLLAALPLLMAIGTRGRGRLRPAVAVPFVASAVSLVAVPGMYPNGNEKTSWGPLWLGSDPHGLSYEAAIQLGNLAALAYLAVLAWTLIAVVTTTQPVRPAAEPPRTTT